VIIGLNVSCSGKPWTDPAVELVRARGSAEQSPAASESGVFPILLTPV